MARTLHIRNTLHKRKYLENGTLWRLLTYKIRVSYKERTQVRVRVRVRVPLTIIIPCPFFIGDPIIHGSQTLTLSSSSCDGLATSDYIYGYRMHDETVYDRLTLEVTEPFTCSKMISVHRNVKHFRVHTIHRLTRHGARQNITYMYLEGSGQPDYILTW